MGFIKPFVMYNINYDYTIRAYLFHLDEKVMS